MLNYLRPNTGVKDSVLSSNILLCCGEDYGELITALTSTDLEPPREKFFYRCYRFVKFDRFTLVWTGIGSGCLEPLLYEVLADGPIERIVLIGTAGALSERASTGNAAPITGAINALNPFSTQSISVEKPSREFNGDGLTIASSDLYYGFSSFNSQLIERLHTSFRGLRSRFEEIKDRADLIDMETAQFYTLCRIYGNSRLSYVAFKGAANSAAKPSDQTLYSLAVLKSALKQGLRCLFG
jgi:uridine phosphorylase